QMSTTYCYAKSPRWVERKPGLGAGSMKTTLAALRLRRGYATLGDPAVHSGDPAFRSPALYGRAARETQRQEDPERRRHHGVARRPTTTGRTSPLRVVPQI